MFTILLASSTTLSNLKKLFILSYFFGWSVSSNQQSPDLKGIPLEKFSLYTNKDGVFRCFNDTTKSFPTSYINDDYCDCADGSDEPGTSACPNSLFYCRNEGHIPAYIRSSRVNDNVCDEECCDGSDEYDSLVNCPNNCFLKHRQYIDQRKEEYKTLKQGLKQKNIIIQNYIKTKANYAAKLELIKPRLEQLKLDLDVIKTQKEEKQTKINKLDSSNELNKLNNENSRLHDQNTNLRQIISKLNTIMSTLEAEHNPNYHDMAVKRSIEEYRILKQQNEPYFTSTTQTNLDHIINSDNELNKEPIAEPMQKVEQQTPIQSINDEYQAIELGNCILNKTERNDLEAKQNQIEDEINKLTQETETINKVLALPQDKYTIMNTMFEQCLETIKGKYTYTICINKDVYQRSDTEDILLGYFEKMENNTLKYTNGQTCWNGPARSVDVNLICYNENLIESVSEPSKCEYSVKLLTPMACIEQDLEKYNDTEYKFEKEQSSISDDNNDKDEL